MPASNLGNTNTMSRGTFPAGTLVGFPSNPGGRIWPATCDPSASVIRVAEKADDLMIVVAGGVGRKAAYLPTWGGTTKAVSRAIKNRN